MPVPKTTHSRTAIDHIGFEIENLREFCQQLEAKGIQFEVPYREIEALGLAIAFLPIPVACESN